LSSRPFTPQRARAIGEVGRCTESIPPHLRREVTTVDADVLVWNGPDVEQDQFALSVDGRTGHEAALLMVFAAIALLLATTGLYAVVAQAVTRRVPEIGVRAAMGARPSDIRAMVFTEGMRPAAVGLAIGIAAALIAGPVLRSELVGIVPRDPATMLVGAAALLVSAALACTIPARRATRIDPIVALREE
jgi:ABC-type antimicrobial peptide transport system permease subunit